MIKLKDLKVGYKKEMLTVIEIMGLNGTNRIIKCKCDCGNIRELLFLNFKKHNVFSCGCYHDKLQSLQMTQHGLYYHPLQHVWNGIKDRCFNPTSKYYKDYGGRGITICEEWRNDFKVFYDWCISNGWQKGLEIDRYPNNNSNYEPNNCRFTSRKNNCRNRRNTFFITYEGETKPLSEWSEIMGINYHTLYERLKRKRSIETLFEPALPTYK